MWTSLIRYLRPQVVTTVYSGFFVKWGPLLMAHNTGLTKLEIKSRQSCWTCMAILTLELFYIYPFFLTSKFLISHRTTNIRVLVLAVWTSKYQLQPEKCQRHVAGSSFRSRQEQRWQDYHNIWQSVFTLYIVSYWT